MGWAAATLLAGGALVSARGDGFPAQGDFNGMAVSCSIAGASVTTVKDPPADFTWTRTVTGTLVTHRLTLVRE
jgi:hypothetical protein